MTSAIAQPSARRKFWGWGLEGEGLSRSELEELGGTFAARFGLDGVRMQDPPQTDELELPASRLSPPDSLAAIFSADPYDRAAHTYGRSFRDLVRAFRRDYAHAPDLVAFPRDERDVAAVLEWCGGARAAAIPFGGGSSVAGGVEPDVGDGYRGSVSVDLRRLDGLLEVDSVSRAARIAAGTLGPALEAQLKPHDLTLRHFPQSFEWSTLGGWIATRSGGHFATLHTRIDEFVESVRVVTPRGVLETRRLPASGAGPSPERLICGSEGTLGVITEAWMRLQPRPVHRAGA
jgi:alkyldihydroxyacetonephosphate synthase